VVENWHGTYGRFEGPTLSSIFERSKAGRSTPSYAFGSAFGSAQSSTFGSVFDIASSHVMHSTTNFAIHQSFGAIGKQFAITIHFIIM
jgi:hypothetical protein